MTRRLIKEITHSVIFEKPNIFGLFKYPEGHANVQVQGAQKLESRDVYEYTLSGAGCSATPQMSVFQQPRNGGFTLLEILIAIFILGLVMATAYVSYSSILKTSKQMEEESNIYKMARTSLDRMMKDLSSLQLSAGNFDLRAEKKTLSKRDFYSLAFWSASHLAFGENEKEGRPATISYYVQEDEGGESFSLWRADLSGAKPSQEKTPSGGFVICQNIESLNFKFYDANAKEYDSWDSSLGDQKGKAPTAIKIELALVNIHDKEKPYKFMTKLFLPVKK